MNYQYRFGGTALEAARDLWKQGGVLRFYRGVSFALLQGPLSRFGSTAANEAMLSLTAQTGVTGALALGAATGAASLAAGLWRLLIMPLDTCKTVLQVQGSEGFATIVARVRLGQVGALYTGAVAAGAAAALGHYPWFATFNYLNKAVAVPAAGAPAVAVACNCSELGVAFAQQVAQH